MPKHVDYTEQIGDLSLAERRILEEGNRNFVPGLFHVLLELEDFAQAQNVYDYEHNIVYAGNKRLTSKGIFRGAMYTLLSVQQDFPVLEHVYKHLERKERNILGNATPHALAQILRPMSLRRQKRRFITALQDNWQDHNLTRRINVALHEGVEAQTQLIDHMDKNVLGFSTKTAPMLLRMCGADDLVVPDSQLQKGFYFRGFADVTIERYVKGREHDGKNQSLAKIKPNGKSTNACIELTNKYAQLHEVSPAIYQIANWVRLSTYRRELRNNLKKSK